MKVFPFIGGSYSSRSKKINCERTVNLYPELETPTSKTPTALLPTPGKVLFTNVGTGGIRGMFRFDAARSIVVSGTSVILLRADGTSVPLGTCTAGSTPVSMASNGSKVVLVMGGAGSKGYIIDPVALTFNEITDPDYLGADKVDFLDGRFVFNVSGTGKFQYTPLYSTDFNALDFATAEGFPDNLISLIVDHRELWLFGETTTEVFYTVSDVDNPIQRIQGSFIETGIGAAHSVAKVDNTIVWMGADDRGDCVVYKANGYTPLRISDHALEYQINQINEVHGVSDAVAYSYQQEGHTFYVLNFPAANKTFAYDASTGLWCDREWYDEDTGTGNRDRGQCHMKFAGKNLIGDWETGNIYYLSLDDFTDNGGLIRRIRRAPHLGDPNMRNVIYDWLRVDMEVGVGLSVAPGSSGHNPMAVLRVSDDGGKTFEFEQSEPIGKLGETKTFVQFSGLGASKDRVFEFVVTDKVKVVLLGATVSTRTARV